MLEIQPYQPTDYDAVSSLYKNRAAYGGVFDATRDTAERLMATSEAGNLYVARDNGMVVGTCMILDNPHSFWLLRFAVDPALENAREVSEALLAKAQEVAHQRGHPHIIVYTDSDDRTLSQRYEDLGFHQASNYRCYWKETTA